MVVKVMRNRIPVSVGIPLYLLEIIDKKVFEQNYKSRSDLVVKILQEKFKLPNQ